MSDDQSRILDCVHPARREFLKRLLASAAFAAPVIATFSVDSLTLDSVHAMGSSNITNISNQVCAGDVGYVGPTQFQAHVSTGGILSTREHRVNGQVLLTARVSGDVANFITGEVLIVPGASVQRVSILIDGLVAAHVSCGGSFAIYSSNLETRLMCDMDELVDFIAAGKATCTVAGTYNGRLYNASGQIYSAITPPQ